MPGGNARPIATNIHEQGFGDSVRFRVTRDLSLKASYEQDQRNASREGTFGAFEGDRIPNRPRASAFISVHPTDC